MRLTAGESPEETETTIRQLRTKLGNCRSASDYTREVVRIIKWAEEATMLLGSHFPRGDARRLILDDKAWDLLWRYHLYPEQRFLLDQAMAFLDDGLGKLLDDLRQWREFSERNGEIVVLDTSAFIQGPPFRRFDWSKEVAGGRDTRLVVPILVIEELDNLKQRKKHDRAGEQARGVLRDLRDLPQARPQHPSRGIQLK